MRSEILLRVRSHWENAKTTSLTNGHHCLLKRFTLSDVQQKAENQNKFILCSYLNNKNNSYYFLVLIHWIKSLTRTWHTFYRILNDGKLTSGNFFYQKSTSQQKGNNSGYWGGYWHVLSLKGIKKFPLIVHESDVKFYNWLRIFKMILLIICDARYSTPTDLFAQYLGLEFENKIDVYLCKARVKPKT